MKLQVLKGTTSKLLTIFIADSTSSSGAGLTGLVFNSAGLSAYYYREGAVSATAITLATMTLGTWTSGGFVVIDATNLPGFYSLAIPDAALASGVNSVVVLLKGATNMVPIALEIQLQNLDPYDAVRAGLTALPNAAAAAASGLITAGGTGNVLPSNAIAAASFAAGAIDATAIATDAIGSAELAASAVTEIQSGLATAAALATVQADTDDIQARLPAALVSGRIDASVGAMAAGTVTAAAVATGAIDADALATDAVTEIATGILAMDWTGFVGEAAHSVLNALRFLRNRWGPIVAGSLSVYKEDATTVAYTKTVSTTPGADPVTAVSD